MISAHALTKVIPLTLNVVSGKAVRVVPVRLGMEHPPLFVCEIAVWTELHYMQIDAMSLCLELSEKYKVIRCIGRRVLLD
jgi:hypothetical protein